MSKAELEKDEYQVIGEGQSFAVATKEGQEIEQQSEITAQVKSNKGGNHLKHSEMEGKAEGEINSGVPITYDDETGGGTFIASKKTIVSDSVLAEVNSFLPSGSRLIT
tara:strand:- start:167 stop:490 length:324 start_codon:yes stop_codon:yes gene_type:complete